MLAELKTGVAKPDFLAAFHKLHQKHTRELESINEKNFHLLLLTSQICLANCMEQIPSSDIDNRSAGHEIPALYKSLIFITMFNTAREWSVY
jgi:hypothetical protein